MDNVENMIEKLKDCDGQDLDEDYFFIPINCEDQSGLKLDNEKFSMGLSDYSYVCGAITALCNSGLKPAEAIEYIVNKDTIKHNIDVSNITANATIESAKYASIKAEMESL